MKQPSSPHSSVFTWLKNNTFRRPSSPVKTKGTKAPKEESTFLNWIFSTSHRAANLRLFFFFAILILFWGLIVVVQESCPRCDEIIFTLRTNPQPVDQVVLNIISLVGHTLLLFISPRVFPHILALLIPFWLAWKVASIYLDDIFELKNVRLAGKFLTRTAFALPDYERIDIKEGRISDPDKNSTAIKIGGPAFARVHLENAAVFVHPDGTPEVVGPTSNLPQDLYIMPGFTRLRQAVDLRPQTIPLESISSRTRDGIPVQIKNIRLLFSIQRGTRSPDLKHPYPFSPEAILSLVFRQPGSGNQSGVLSRTIISLVSAELARFISTYPLAELISTIGKPEINRQIELDSKIRQDIEKLRQRKFRAHKLGIITNIPRKTRARPYHRFYLPAPVFRNKATPPSSKFIPRTRLSSLFYAKFTEEFSGGFPGHAQQRGVSLEWIDVGTWNPLENPVSTQNLEAFHISNENITRGHQRVLDNLRNQSRINELKRLNHIHPVASFHEYYRNNFTKQEIIISIIKDYRSLFQLVIENYIQTKQKVPPSLVNALNILNLYLNLPRRHYPD